MYQNELRTALEAARRAGEYLKDAYEKFKAIPDAPADISTVADRDSQEIILQTIHTAFPGDALCAEEKTPTLAAATHTGERLWIVDPIDGTRGFAQKNGEFSVMIGYVHQGRIAVGVVLEPALERLTWAVQGGGSWGRIGQGRDERVRVTTTQNLDKATLVQSRTKNPGVPSRQVQRLRPGNIIETHSAGVKLVLVARGIGDLYVNHYPRFHDWDICAGHILVTEAGGKVTGLGGQEIRYGEVGAGQFYGLLASNGVIHTEALEKLEGMME